MSGLMNTEVHPRCPACDTRTQDALDGAALRRLREAYGDGFDLWVDYSGFWLHRWEDDDETGYTGSTIAEAADKCREALATDLYGSDDVFRPERNAESKDASTNRASTTQDALAQHSGTHQCYGRLWDASMSLRYGQCPYRAGAQQERDRLRAALKDVYRIRNPYQPGTPYEVVRVDRIEAILADTEDDR